MTPALPLVSIVMPCFNTEQHLARSVGSVLAQTFAAWELIAVDDGSTDGTLARLQLQRDPRLQIVTQANQGVSAARNAGLARARGEFVAFLDADDAWEPTFLDAMHAALSERPDAVLAYCGWQNVGLPGGRGQPFVPPDHETPTKEEELFVSCRWPIHAALVRRRAVQRVGGFDTRLKNAEDYLLWLRLAVQAPIVRVPQVLAYYHFHGAGQASAQFARAALQHLQAQREYLREQPRFSAALGRRRRRELTLGGLMQRGFECYWKRDLRNARTIFREVMRHGYGKVRDWAYMLPAWLPEQVHLKLMSRRDRQDTDAAN
jgi:glycosyltransferase involved in cell wall biosynthesis